MIVRGGTGLIVGLLCLGGVIGAGGVFATVTVNKATSTTAFCTSCHSMARLGADAGYQASAHVSNRQGVVVECGDCHIAAPNIFIESYNHAVHGLKDAYAEFINDYSNPAIWEMRRIELAHHVRAQMRQEDSATCRSCHVPDRIAPEQTEGQAAHALLQSQEVTCIDCHINLVHRPVPPSPDFLRESGLGRLRAPAERQVK